MQQSPIAKKLQSGSIFCFWFLGTASRGCHGWNDSGLAHAPSGKPVKNTMERHRIIPTERCTGATRGQHCGLLQILCCAEHDPIAQINPRHAFGLYCYSSLNKKKPPEGGLLAKASTGFIRSAFCTDDYWYRASFQWCPCRSHLLDQLPMHTSLLL